MNMKSETNTGYVKTALYNNMRVEQDTYHI